MAMMRYLTLLLLMFIRVPFVFALVDSYKSAEYITHMMEVQTSIVNKEYSALSSINTNFYQVNSLGISEGYSDNFFQFICTIAAKSAPKLTGVIEQHHLLPKAKEFSKFFKRAGLDVEKFKIPLDKAVHRLKPTGVHTNAGGNWNKVWREFFKAIK